MVWAGGDTNVATPHLNGADLSIYWVLPFAGILLSIAVFPLLWVLVMSIKLPVDSFASNPLEVIFGPATKLQVGGLSIINLLVIGAMIYLSLIHI